MGTNYEERFEPLINDPKREANDSMRGYQYQILRSVLAWIQLGWTEAIYLEGAEDFDSFRPSEVMVSQVKNTQTNITLRSQDVLKAIESFWEHKKNNRRDNIKVQFQFLTTSDVGMENGDPLGFKIKGLFVWEKAKENGTLHQENYLTALQNFLSFELKLSENLTEWLKLSSKNDFLEELIEPISWLTGEGNSEDVIRQIEEHLVKYGMEQTPEFTYQDAKGVLPALIVHAWKVVTKDKDRWLYYSDFIKLFENHMQIPVQKNLFRKLISNSLQNQLVNQRSENFSNYFYEPKTVMKNDRTKAPADRFIDFLDSLRECIKGIPMNLSLLKDCLQTSLYISELDEFRNGLLEAKQPFIELLHDTFNLNIEWFKYGCLGPFSPATEYGKGVILNQFLKDIIQKC